MEIKEMILFLTKATEENPSQDMHSTALNQDLEHKGYYYELCRLKLELEHEKRSKLNINPWYRANQLPRVSCSFTNRKQQEISAIFGTATSLPIHQSCYQSLGRSHPPPFKFHAITT